MDLHSTFDFVRQHQENLRREAAASSMASWPGARRGLVSRLRRAQPPSPRGRPPR
jgi:hypothetical protein